MTSSISAARAKYAQVVEHLAQYATEQIGCFEPDEGGQPEAASHATREEKDEGKSPAHAKFFDQLKEAHASLLDAAKVHNSAVENLEVVHRAMLRDADDARAKMEAADFEARKLAEAREALEKKQHVEPIAAADAKAREQNVPNETLAAIQVKLKEIYDALHPDGEEKSDSHVRAPLNQSEEKHEADGDERIAHLESMVHYLHEELIKEKADLDRVKDEMNAYRMEDESDEGYARDEEGDGGSYWTQENDEDYDEGDEDEDEASTFELLLSA